MEKRLSEVQPNIIQKELHTYITCQKAGNDSIIERDWLFQWSNFLAAVIAVNGIPGTSPKVVSALPDRDPFMAIWAFSCFHPFILDAANIMKDSYIGTNSVISFSTIL